MITTLKVKDVYTSEFVKRGDIIGCDDALKKVSAKEGYLIRNCENNCFGVPVRIYYDEENFKNGIKLNASTLNDIRRYNCAKFENGEKYRLDDMVLLIDDVIQCNEILERKKIDYGFYGYFSKIYEKYLEELQKAISVNVVGSVTLTTNWIEDELNVVIEDRESKITIPIPDFSENIIHAVPINETAGFVTAKYITKRLEGILNRPEAIKPWIRSVMKDVDLNE